MADIAGSTLVRVSKISYFVLVYLNLDINDTLFNNLSNYIPLLNDDNLFILGDFHIPQYYTLHNIQVSNDRFMTSLNNFNIKQFNQITNFFIRS